MLSLTDREKLVLEAIVKSFILYATPVASSLISKKGSFSFSAATVRNIMASLEEKGYISQPHTSSGRVPTTLGYRFYVDHMMRRARLSNNQKDAIKTILAQTSTDFDVILKESAKILAQLSNQLSVIITPQFDEGVFQRMDLARLSSERLLIVISIKSGMVKTIFLEVASDLKDKYLTTLREILNERLFGLKLHEIQGKFSEIVKDIPEDRSGLVPLFMNAAHKIFDFSEEDEIYVTGTHNILRQPEFADNIKVSGVVELLEEKRVIVHLLEEDESGAELKIQIGEEIEERNMKSCSIVSAKYKVGDMVGNLGIIGPMRMNYSHIIPLVDFTAHFISDSFEERI